MINIKTEITILTQNSAYFWQKRRRKWCLLNAFSQNHPQNLSKSISKITFPNRTLSLCVNFDARSHYMHKPQNTLCPPRQTSLYYTRLVKPILLKWSSIFWFSKDKEVVNCTDTSKIFLCWLFICYLPDRVCYPFSSLLAIVRHSLKAFSSS